MGSKFVISYTNAQLPASCLFAFQGTGNQIKVNPIREAD